MTAYAAFLTRAGWDGAACTPLAGDASNRRYMRVRLGNRRAVLMDAAPERGEDTGPFLQIAAHLRHSGLHAPEVYATDPERGIVLLEDLGDGLYARVFETTPELQNRLYTAAIDVLLRLHGAPLPGTGVPNYSAEPMAAAATLAATWYASAPDSASKLSAAMGSALATLDWSNPVLVLRDYHAENLIWMDGFEGLAKVGLLDFQDAARGHPVYDVISLMQDARRDVPEPVADAMATHYCTASNMDRDLFTRDAAVLGAQRALRILGVFARLSLHFNKPDYVDLIPRVWAQLEANLAHPALQDLHAVARTILPPPTPEYLDTLRQKAGTCPTL
ncbi:aminoglycoside phosphotransferase family protein [Tropicimonas sp. S265A]|uniref:aminoglycoside phosphotransferase family protein n=1 Tax=Tropicimonas sp. S265A TaxID=3415134 RepID=UPI003C7AF36C